MKSILLAVLSVVTLSLPCAAQDSSVVSSQAVYAAGFEPPAQYREWYKDTEKCMGQKGDFDKIIFAATPGPWNQHVQSDAPGKVTATYGMWHNLSGDTALVVLNTEDWDNQKYVQHEFIHDILWRNGWRIKDGSPDVPDSVNIRRAHPAPPYEKCAPTYIEDLRKWKQQHDQQQQASNPWKRVYRP